MANNLLLESDVFTGGALAGGWAAMHGLSTSQVVGSNPYYAEPAATSTQYGQIWTGITWPVDQSSELTVHTLTAESGTVLSLHVRWSSSAQSGYQADFTNSTALLYIVTAGSKTQLGSTVTGLTFATGDVWCLQIMGSEIILYKNDLKVAYWGDATYTSGSPGFSQSSTVNITHSQVASWRGYSGQSQDGIWTKGYNGVVSLMSPIASELGSVGTGQQGVQNPDFLHEGNAQILSGTVYKMWFITTVSASASHVGYAESYTGLPGSWVRYSGNPIISGSSNSVSVWKNAGIYYVFIGGITLLTSANGISGFTNHGNILTTGTTGAWDAGALQIAKVIYFDGTTATLKYDGFAAGDTATGIGLATATSPFTTWTKYAGNPVVTNFFGCTIPYIDGAGNYYFWSCSTRGGGLDPANAVRLKTAPPFTTWTSKTFSIRNTQQYEGYNDVAGGVYPIYMFTPPTAPNTTYFYYESWVEDSVAGELYQFAFAQSPLPLSAIVQNNEDGAPQIASDSFTSGTGNLSSNWGVITGINRLQIIAGDLVEGISANANNAQIYTGSTFSNDQYSEITIATLTASTDYCLPYVRMQASGLNGYGFKFTGPATGGLVSATIVKTVGGANTNLSPTIGFRPNVGDVIRIAAWGSSPVIVAVYQNGYLVYLIQDYANTFTSGSPAMYIYTGTLSHAQISNWAGGNFNQGGIVAGATLTGPSSGAVGVPSTNFTLTPASQTTDGYYPSDSGNGGTFTPSVLSSFMASSALMFTYTPVTGGAIPISVVSGAGQTITNSPLTYMVSGGASTASGACLLAGM